MCRQRSTGASAEAPMIVQGIYQQNMQNGHRTYFTELVIPQYTMFSHLPSFAHAVSPACNILLLLPHLRMLFPSPTSQLRCTFSK